MPGGELFYKLPASPLTDTPFSLPECTKLATIDGSLSIQMRQMTFTKLHFCFAFKTPWNETLRRRLPSFRYEQSRPFA